MRFFDEAGRNISWVPLEQSYVEKRWTSSTKPLLSRPRYEKSRGVVGEGKSRREERDFERPWMGTTRVETFTRMAEQS